MQRSRGLLGALLCLGAVSACGDDATGGDASADAAPDAGRLCESAEDCDDGVFCNGVEACVDSQCVAGASIACNDGVECTIDVCDEELNRCVAAAPDADGDGVRDAACVDGEGVPLGADCDDTDPNRFPGNPEVCDEEAHDEDCNLETFGAIDRDGDGYFDARCCNPTADGTGQTCGLDCDDVRPNVNPAATEACDRIDNDCDLETDEDVTVAGFVDADRDGFGDHEQPLTSCPGVAGFVPEGGPADCDDADPTRNPGQVEVCDGENNDCDANVDESPQDVPWYLDVDGDGFGSEESGVVVSCSPPPPQGTTQYVLLGTDCNDGVAGISPAVAEACNGIDDDCNGVADFLIDDGDFEDDDEDGIADIACGGPRGIDCDDQDPITGGGGEEACDGRDNDCDGSVDENATDRQWFWDNDGDGHGSAANPANPVLLACRPQPGYVASGGDCADTDPNRNPDAMEVCNALDDNCDGTADESNVCGCPSGLGDCVGSDGVCETNTFSDLANCGGCGITCSNGANTRSVFCGGGTCTVAGCRLGYDDCDSDPDNGCEINVLTDTGNCGACGNVCEAVPGTNVASVRCDGLECMADTCSPGFGDCDEDLANGCESPVSSDPENCGECGNQCGNGPSGPRTCVMGTCFSECTPLSGDCDGDTANGCETPLGDVANCGACGSACPASDSQTDVFCDVPPGGGAFCRTQCRPGFADCDGDPDNGCEAAVSLASCGCGAPLDPPEDCVATLGSGAIASCVGFAPGNAECQSDGCSAGFTDCGGRCVDLDNDPSNCGACGENCGSGTCMSASCDCPGDDIFCAGVGCVDILSDPRNCGGCGIDCGSDPCVESMCDFSCVGGFAECDSDPMTFCETDVRSDIDNCGDCGRRCPRPGEPTDNVTSGACSLGDCQFTCSTGFGDCDGDPATGCESVLDTPIDCGACGLSCGVGGVCSLATCDTVLSLATGATHSCAVRTGGAVACWGENGDGQLGFPGPGGSTVPQTVAMPGEARAIALGAAHSCAIVQPPAGTDAEVWCWGDNQFGQLGDGTTADRSAPVQAILPAGYQAEALAIGSFHSCVAARDSGPGVLHVFCWGSNALGQVGDGSSPTNRLSPVRVEDGGSPVQVSSVTAGDQHTCVIIDPISASIDFACWGSNAFGQLGDGTTTPHGVPNTASIFAFSSITPKIVAGDDHTCVLGDDLYCWGRNDDQQAADTVGNVLSPTQLAVPTAAPPVSLVATQGATCLVLGDRRVECRGDNGFGLVPGGPASIATWTRVVALGNAVQEMFAGPGAGHYAVLSTGARAFAWGDNTAGRLGLGSTGGTLPPTQVADLTP